MPSAALVLGRVGWVKAEEEVEVGDLVQWQYDLHKLKRGLL